MVKTKLIKKFLYLILATIAIVCHGRLLMEACAVPSREQARMLMDRLLIYYPDLLSNPGIMPNNPNMMPFQQQQQYGNQMVPNQQQQLQNGNQMMPFRQQRGGLFG